MWLSLAFAGSLEVLGDPAFRAPDGIVDAGVAPDGAAWVISEHGSIVGFETDGSVRATFEACSARGPHTELWLAPEGTHLGVICEDRYRVLGLPGGEPVFEVAFQVRDAWLTEAELLLVGEPFEGGETGTTRLARFALPGGGLLAELEGDFAAPAWIDTALVALERSEPVNTDAEEGEEGEEAGAPADSATSEREPTSPGWRLVRILGEEATPRAPTPLSFPGDEPPRLTRRGTSTVCLTRGRSGRCYDVSTEAEVPWRTQDRPFVAPDQDVPICGGSRCYDVDLARLRPAGTAPGIGRIEDLAASADGKHLLTRDHRDQLLHHGPKGRRPIARTDGAIAISPSGRYAWYQTARRSIRVRLIDGVRTTLPRATAAVFDTQDDLWLAVPHQANTTLLSKLPTGLEAPLPIIPLHDGRQITGLQLQADRLLLEYAQDDLFAVVDLIQRAPVGPNGKPTRKPHREHLFTERTPLMLTASGSVLRTVANDEGYEVRGSLDSQEPRVHETALHTSSHPVMLGGGRSGVELVDGMQVDSFMGTHRRSAELPGPAYRIWVYDERVYIALRDGRLAILD